MAGSKGNTVGIKPTNISSHTSISEQSPSKGLLYHARTIWLFSYSDIKTILVPQSTFGLVTALALVAGDPTTASHDTQPILNILTRLPLVILWVWINLLAFNINGQRQPSSIREDLINKPYRPMPSRRLSSRAAHHGAAAAYMAAILMSFLLGAGFPSCFILGILGYAHDVLGGNDSHPFIRNLLNALGYTFFGVGALEVALGHELVTFSQIKTGSFLYAGTAASSAVTENLAVSLHPRTPNPEAWLAVIAAMIFTTIQMQDLYDMPGDAARGRHTMPLYYGETVTRYLSALAVMFWSFFCPWFWNIEGWWGHYLNVPLASVVACRCVKWRTIEADTITFKLYNAWIAAVYLLPLIKTLSGQSR